MQTAAGQFEVLIAVFLVAGLLCLMVLHTLATVFRHEVAVHDLRHEVHRMREDHAMHLRLLRGEDFEDDFDAQAFEIVEDIEEGEPVEAV